MYLYLTSTSQEMSSEERAMTTMIRWSPYMPKLHWHHHHDVNGLFQRIFDGAPDEAAQPAASWLPAAEGRLENGTYVIQLALPGVDPKDVEVSLMDNVLTVKGERKADPGQRGQGLLRPRGRVRRIPAELHAPRGRRRRPSGGQGRERHARGEGASPPSATRRMIEVKAA